MPDDRIISQGVQRPDQQRNIQQQQAQRLGQYAIAQEAAQTGFQEWSDLNAWNPLALARNFQTLDKRVREKKPDHTSQAEKPEGEEEVVVEDLQETAEDFQRKNPELQARTLLALRARISAKDSVADILRKLREAYSDPTLIDEVLDFLLKTADTDLKRKLEQAKAELYRQTEREIKAGKNIAAQARNFSGQGLGAPKALRDLYRNITGNPRDAHTLFQELINNYTFDKMKIVIDFMLHSLGADIKSKGPSISRPELERLLQETRNMQAILGLYRFFYSRMRLIASAFERQGLTLPQKMTFETLARLFMRFIQEKYPSVEKALMISTALGIQNEIAAQLIIFLQFRDAMRGVAPRLFRNEKHRQELLLCFIETMEELEEEKEEDEEEKEKK